MRCIIYARFSTERQSEASIADQLRVCREYAAERGWSVAGEHTDEGISGAALGNRPGAQAALRDLAAGEVLLVNDLSRMSRSQDLAPLLTRLVHRGARVIGVQDGFDSAARTARMQAGLSGIMSEEFRAMIGDRTWSAHERLAKDGKSTGGKSYGDVTIIREVFTRFAAGETMKALVSDLNRRGIPSPGADWKTRTNTRGRWLVSALHALLHNERYAGRVIWNRSRWVKDPDSGRRIRRERPEAEWIVTEIEPVIDAQTWSAVQARFRTHSGRGGVRRYLLSGILECAVSSKRRFARVEWEDSSSSSRIWNSHDTLRNAANTRCVSIGYVVHEDEKAIVIAGHRGDTDDFAGDMRIPKRCIVKQKYVKEPK